MKQRTKFLNTTIKLLGYNTTSGNEGIMKEYMLAELSRLGFKTDVDKIGNISAVRGKADKYPLLNAHMDIVNDTDDSIIKLAKEIVPDTKKEIGQSERSCGNCSNVYDCVHFLEDEEGMSWSEAYRTLTKDSYTAYDCTSYAYDNITSVKGRRSLYDDDYAWANGYSYSSYYSSWSLTSDQQKKVDKLLEKKFKILYDAKTGKISSNKLRILGGDDKCGIAIALQTAREMPKAPMKMLFTVKEEVGCVGAGFFCENNKEWFEDVKYSLTLDRRDIDQLLMFSAGGRNCTNEFCAKIAQIGIMTGINVKIDTGTIADVMEIRDLVKETVNMSAGYYSAHTTSEWIDFNGMCGIKEWVKNIIVNV